MAMECAGWYVHLLLLLCNYGVCGGLLTSSVAIAVGGDIFHPDANALAELFGVNTEYVSLSHHLISSLQERPLDLA
jgi:hypothetical protein